MNRRWHKLAVLPIVLSLAVAACGDDDDEGSDGTTAPPASEGSETTRHRGRRRRTTAAGDDEDFGGAKVLITGSERDDPSVGAINTVLDAFGEANNIDITFTGDADWEANINTQVEGGNPPNIGIFPQPGKLADFASAGSIKPLADRRHRGHHRRTGRPDYSDYANVDGSSVRRAGQDRPEVARVVPAGGVRGSRLRGARRRSTSSPRSSRR